MSEKKLTLFDNAVVHTLDERRPLASWFTVLGESVQRVGRGPPPEDVRRRIDLGGRCVVPGFVDSHIHFFQTGLDSLFVDLSGARSLADVCGLLEAGARGKRSWLFAHSFEEDKLADATQLTRRELDRAFPYRPVWINRVDYHSAVVNTAALRRLELPPSTPGMLRGDDGEPNGILRAQAYMHAKTRVSRMVPVDVKERAVKAAAQACVARGITAVHALEGGKLFGDEGVQVVLKKIDALPLDLTLFLQEMNTVFCTRLGFRHLGGCVLLDGSIGSYTAALDEDYLGQPGARGVLYEKPRDLSAFVEEAHEAGAQLAFHAIGPRAIEQVLSAYERAFEKSPRFDHRHRIEHFELATDEQIERCAEIGVVVAMQPTFEQLWGGPDGMYASRLGERWRRTNRLRTITARGVVVAGGSDANVTPPDPLLGIHAAVNHPNEDERISPQAALRMMTLDAAYAAFNDARHGSIQPGKEASFVVLDEDLLAVEPARIRHIAVRETWSLGRKVFDHAEQP